jgi:hypothetical protein
MYDPEKYPELSERDQKTYDTVHSVLSCAELPESKVLYRGTSRAELGKELRGLPADQLAGHFYTDPALMSTSQDRSRAEFFSEGMVVIVGAPKGAHALDVSSISQIEAEHEFLFDSGQKMFIESATEKDGILYVSVMVR